MPSASPLQQLAGALDPVVYAANAGLTLDPWQQQVVRTDARRVIVAASRQAGKSTTIGTSAIHTAQIQPDSEIVIGAVKQEQSAEMLRKALAVYNVAGSWIEGEIEHESITRVEFTNRSRLIAVTGKAATVRSFSALRMLIVDEAAYVPDEFYMAVFPMLAVSRGRAILLSTAHAKAGVFYDIWTNSPEWDFTRPADDQEDAWLKVKVPWWECPRIRPAFIEAERRRFGDAYVAREYCVTFQDAVTAAFSSTQVDAMVSDDVEGWTL